MKERLEFKPNNEEQEIKVDKTGQTEIVFNEKPKVFHGEVEEEYKNHMDDITHLSPDDLIALEVEDPVAYQALMDKIEKYMEAEEIEQIISGDKLQETTDIKTKEESTNTSLSSDESYKKALDKLYERDLDEPFWKR